MRGVFRLLVWLLVLGCIWLGAFGWFVRTVNSYPQHDTTKADAIIVLTGGGGRVESGLQLLANGRGKALFISGVNKNVPLGDLINKAPMGIREVLGVLSLGKITLGRDATNTIGNAEESAQWVRRRDYQTVLLVTADYHMPRSLVEFRAALPEVTFIPTVVKTQDYAKLDWLNDPAMRELMLAEFHKLVAARLRHLLLTGDNAA